MTDYADVAWELDPHQDIDAHGQIHFHYHFPELRPGDTIQAVWTNHRDQPFTATVTTTHPTQNPHLTTTVPPTRDNVGNLRQTTTKKAPHGQQ